MKEIGVAPVYGVSYRRSTAMRTRSVKDVDGLPLTLLRVVSACEGEGGDTAFRTCRARSTENERSARQKAASAKLLHSSAAGREAAKLTRLVTGQHARWRRSAPSSLLIWGAVARRWRFMKEDRL